MKLKVLFHHRLRKDGKKLLQIRISHGNETKYYDIAAIRQRDFNLKTKRVNEDVINSPQINQKIISTLTKLESYSIENKYLKIADYLKKLETDIRPANSKISLLEFMETFIDDCKNSKALNPKTGKPILKNTYRNYDSLFYHLKVFSQKKRPINFEDINTRFYNEFVGFLRNDFYSHVEKYKSKGVKGLMDNTIGTDIKNIKIIMSRAVDLGLTTNMEFRHKDFRTIAEETDSIYLNENEIQKIVNAKLPNHLKGERDRFIVSYSLLLRFSDSVSLSKEMVFEQGGRNYIRLNPIKTGDEVIIPLKDSVHNILKKYDFKFGDTNQEANWKLKEIAKAAKLDKWAKVTTHTARRSGATNLYIQSIKTGKPPVKLIMDIGGWKTENSFKKYIRVDRLESAIMASELDFFK